MTIAQHIVEHATDARWLGVSAPHLYRIDLAVPLPAGTALTDDVHGVDAPRPKGRDGLRRLKADERRIWVPVRSGLGFEILRGSQVIRAALDECDDLYRSNLLESAEAEQAGTPDLE